MTKTRHNTNFLSDNCLSATFRWFLPLCLPQRVQVISTPYTRIIIGNISTSLCLVSLSSGIDKQTIPPRSEFSLLTWPVTAPCIGLRDDKRPAGSNRFSEEADKDQVEVDQVGEAEDTHCRLPAGEEANRLAQNDANLKTSNHLRP